MFFWVKRLQSYELSNLQVWKQSSVPSSSLWRISEMWSSWLSSHCPCLPCWDSRSTWESWHKSASKTFPRNLQTSSLAQASTTSVMQIWLDFTGRGTNSTWTQVTGKKWWYLNIVSIFQEQWQNFLVKAKNTSPPLADVKICRTLIISTSLPFEDLCP